MFKKYLTDKKGQGMSEYLILTFLVAVGAIAATHQLKTALNGKMNDITSQISNMKITEGGRGSGQGSGGGLKGAAINAGKDMASDLLGNILK